MNSLLPFILALAIILLLVIRSSIKSKTSSTGRPDFIHQVSAAVDRDDVSAVIEQTPDGVDFDCDVVGESFQRDNLMALVRSHNAFSIGEIYGTAILEPEPTNEFDPTAVKVVFEGVQVGYIPKFDSSAVTQMIKNSGKKEMQVPAKIGFDPNSPSPLIGVRLVLTIE